MQSHANQSLPAISGKQGDFVKKQGDAHHHPAKNQQISIVWIDSPCFQEQGGYYPLAGRISGPCIVEPAPGIGLLQEQNGWPRRPPQYGIWCDWLASRHRTKKQLSLLKTPKAKEFLEYLRHSEF